MSYFRLLSYLVPASLQICAPLSAQTASSYAVTLAYSVGQQAPAPQSIGLSNTSGTVAARISQNIDAEGNTVTSAKDNSGVFAYSVTAGTGGTATVAVGTNPNTSILATLAAKGSNTYTGTLLISDAQCTDCISIAMYLQIGASGQLSVQWNGAPASVGVNLTAATGGSAQTTLVLTTFSAATFTAGSNTTWLIVSPGSGITGTGSPGQAILTLTAYAASLPEGTNYATVSISSSLGSMSVPVTFYVGTSSGLVLSPTSMSFQYVLSNQRFPSGQSYPLSVTGTTAGSTFTASSSSGWLLINGGSSATGVIGSSVTVSVNAPALGSPPPATTQVGYVYVSSNGLSATLTVTLTVTGTYYSGGTLTFYVPVAGGSAAPQYATITGTGSYYTSVVRNNGGTNWVTISPASGLISGSTLLGISVNSWGLGAGTYSATVQVYVNSYYTQTINVIMYAGVGQGTGWMVAAPSSLTFSLPQGGSQSQTLVVNGGGTYFTAQAWGQGISVSPASGITPAALTVTVNGSSLNAGVSSGYITIQSGVSTQTVYVTIHVETGTVIQANPGSVALIWQGASTMSASIQVTSSTDSDGVYQNVAITAPSFVTLSATAGTTPMTLLASINTNALAAGFNTGNIVIVSSGAANSPVYVPVTILSSTSPVSPLVSPTALSLAAVSGGPSVASSVWVSGVGTGYFSAWANTSWLTVSPSSGVTPMTLSVMANPAALAPGTYYGTITVSAYAGAVATVGVSFTVSSTGSVIPTPTLSVTNNKLTFNYRQGDSPPTAQTLTVNSSGASTYFTAASGTSWIAASPGSGGTPATLSISVNPSGLAAGTFTGTVTVTAAGAINSPQTITVVVNVTLRATLVMSADTVKFSCAKGGAAPSTQTVQLSSTGPEMSFTVSKVSESWVSVTPSSGMTPATLTFTANPAGMPAGPHLATVHVATEDATHPISVALALSGTLPTVTAVVNAASLQGTAIAPGEMIRIAGTDMGPDPPASYALVGGVVSTSLSRTRVLVGGYAAPVLYASATTVRAIVPYAIAGRTSVYVQVEYEGQRSNAMTVAVAPSAPGIFTADESGGGQGSILNEDGTQNSADNPAAAGSRIVVYATGEGQTTPPGVDGTPATDVFALPRPVQPVTATVGGLPADVLSAGGVLNAPAGLLQVSLRLPPAAASGEVVITIGGVPSQSSVTVAIR